ncbi:MAG TPA: SRPBCC family protein, partial [bacterium]|nr:SRPBCC family protein [bacterium]
WWPRSIRFQVDPGPVKVGTRMRVSNQGLVRWTAEVTDIQENKKIMFRYFDGAWDGTAAWTLTPEGSGTRVAYSIDIVPVPFWLKALSGVLDLGKIHSKMMAGVLASLQKMFI